MGNQWVTNEQTEKRGLSRDSEGYFQDASINADGEGAPVGHKAERARLWILNAQLKELKRRINEEDSEEEEPRDGEPQWIDAPPEPDGTGRRSAARHCCHSAALTLPLAEEVA
jgi:hypothetical protein